MTAPSTAPTFRGVRLWTRVVAPAGPARCPVLCVPGGPGLAHHYLAPLAGLAARGRPVVFYDPLGSGGSPGDPGAPWSLELLCDELDAVRAGLGLERVHLLAHSAGGFAAVEYALARPERVASLVLSSTPLSVPVYQAAVRRLIDELGPEPAAAFVRGEHDPGARDVRYLRAYYEYVRRHVCRFADQRAFLAQVGAGFNPHVHRALKGGLLLYTASPLADWDATARLAAIAAPVLLTCGRFDVVTPAMCEDARRRLPRAEVRVFARSSHTQHAEEPTAFVDAVADFLDRSE